MIKSSKVYMTSFGWKLLYWKKNWITPYAAWVNTWADVYKRKIDLKEFYSLWKDNQQR